MTESIIVTPCQCPAPGFCARHGMTKGRRLHELCRTRMDYFTSWEERNNQGQSAAIDPMLPCRHRGEKTGTLECKACGGSRVLDVYGCSIPEVGRCTLNAHGYLDAELDSPLGVCLTCNRRQAPDARRIIIHDGLSPGDIAVLTAAIKALHDRYPGRFAVDVRTPCPALFKGNPRLERIDDHEGQHVAANYHAGQYASIHRSDQRPIHFLEAYCESLAAALGLPELKPDDWRQPSIWLTAEEKTWFSQVREIAGDDRPFWLINAGVKRDYTAKRWHGWQEVIDHTKDRVQWVQIGSAEHDHQPLEGALNLLGKTDMRQLVRLVYHAEGVLCGVTALAHLAQWVERGPHNPHRRHAVVIAGGREPPHWFAYPGQHVLHTIGELDCCASGGCWRSRVVPLDIDPKHNKSLCVHPEPEGIGKCMRLIFPQFVSQLVLRLASRS